MIHIRCHNPQQAYNDLAQVAWPAIKGHLLAGGRPLTLEVKEEKRSDAQNRRMWAMLRDISRQVDWYGQKLQEEEWKDVFTAALKRQKVVPGIDGGFVVIGARTSRMPVKEMIELQDFMEAFGAEKGVNFSQDAIEKEVANEC